NRLGEPLDRHAALSWHGLGQRRAAMGLRRRRSRRLQPQRSASDREDQAFVPFFARSGSERTRSPVSPYNALATAGASGGTPGSPTPVGASCDATMCTSTFGISLMRSIG